MPVYISYCPAEFQSEDYIIDPSVFESKELLALDAYNYIHNNAHDFFVTKEEILKVLETNGVYKLSPNLFYGEVSNEVIYWMVMGFSEPTPPEFEEPITCEEESFEEDSDLQEINRMKQEQDLYNQKIE